MEETCILCGDIIPEGRQVCPICEQKYGGKLDERKAMDLLLRQSVLKGPPGGKEIIISAACPISRPCVLPSTTSMNP